MRVKSNSSGSVRRGVLALVLVLGAVPALPGCGDDAEKAASRGLGEGAKSKAKEKEKDKGAAAAGAPKAGEGAVAAPTRPDRPKIILTREDFSEAVRDPFQGFLPIEDDVPGETTVAATRTRDVKMAGYAFEDLSLIGIVRSGKSVQPRALFVSNDGKSKTIRQGEYFSRAEVLLAAVNRDYVEIEVVDEDKARGMNWQVGERRAIYLKAE